METKIDLEGRYLIFKLIFILAWQGSLILIMFNDNPQVHEANPVMKVVLGFHPLEAVVLFMLVSTGLLFSEVKSKITYYALILGSLILLFFERRDFLFILLFLINQWG